MDYKRLEGETEEELIYRICSQKDIIGTWQDIADIINSILGYDYGESTYRKKFQAFQKLMSANEHKILDDDNYIKELKLEREELNKERIKLQTLNLERNRLNREEARQELFYEQIGQYVQSKECVEIEPMFEPQNKQMKYLLGIADVHANAKFSTMTNAYNMGVVRHRFEVLLGKVIQFIQEKKLDEFNIVLLGDLIDGCLRMSNLQAMDTTVSKAIADVSDIIISFVEQIVYCTRVHINLYDVVYANHSMPRFLQNYDVREDLGYTISRYIKTGLRNNANVTIFTPDSNDMYLDFKIWDFNLIGFHGHTEKNQSEAIKELTIQRRKLYDYAVCGHLHCKNNTTNGMGRTYDVETIQFPSFCGDDPYSNSLHKTAKSSCMICGFDKKNGFTESYKFILN